MFSTEVSVISVLETDLKTPAPQKPAVLHNNSAQKLQTDVKQCL